jgi:hypothetical protein
MGTVAKSYMRKAFLIYEEMLKYLVIYEEAFSHCNRSLLDFLTYEENIVFFFISVGAKHYRGGLGGRRGKDNRKQNTVH